MSFIELIQMERDLEARLAGGQGFSLNLGVKPSRSRFRCLIKT